MRLDNKTKDKIVEILAMSKLADEERAQGIAATAESVATLRERAIKRYRGEIDFADPDPCNSQRTYSMMRFHLEVKRTAAAIIQAIEEDDVEAMLREQRLMQMEVYAKSGVPWIGHPRESDQLTTDPKPVDKEVIPD